MYRCRYRQTVPAVALTGAFLFLGQATTAQRNAWIATWAASPQPTAPNPKQPLLNIEDQTVRERVRLSIGGSQIRIRFTNEYGSAPLLIGAATVALAVPNNATRTTPQSIHDITFGGRKSVAIPAGAPFLSDPVTLTLASGSELSISIYFSKRVSTPTIHWLALKHSVISQRGDHTHDENIEGGTQSLSSISLSAVLVPAEPTQRLIVALGDSITDGDESTVDADRNWPSDLARRLLATPLGSQLAVVNEGIIGNRLLEDCFLPPVGCFGPSAIARFDRDALALPGVTHIVLLQGVNDIGFPGATIGDQLLAGVADKRTAQDLTDSYLQLLARAHALGVKLIGATLTPFEGVEVPGYYSDAKEATRQAVNKWIRTSGSFDGVIDFDAVLRDPDHPGRLLAKFASEDHLHPNDAGYQAMADAVDLALFK